MDPEMKHFMGGRTLHCKHEIIQRVLIALVGFGIILLDILVYCALNDFNGTLDFESF
jgi:hypothetical protein